MLHEDVLTTIREHVIMSQCITLEYETYSDHISCLIMEHIIDCEDEGVEPDIMSIPIPEYPSCTGPKVTTIGKCFGI